MTFLSWSFVVVIDNFGRDPLWGNIALVGMKGRPLAKRYVSGFRLGISSTFLCGSLVDLRTALKDESFLSLHACHEVALSVRGSKCELRQALGGGSSSAGRVVLG